MAGTARIPGEDFLIAVHGVGVRFRAWRGREDLRSMAYQVLRRSRQPRDLWALKSANLTVLPGEIIGIIGRNGAGKTTLCRVLAGLLLPDEGAVTRRCEVSALLALGIGFNAELSGRENVYLNGLMLGYSKRQLDRMLPEIQEFSGLGRFITEPLKHYSSGMRARLGFSIASMLDAEVLVIDETLTVGDLEFQQRAGAKMQALVEKAQSVWFRQNHAVPGAHGDSSTGRRARCHTRPGNRSSNSGGRVQQPALGQDNIYLNGMMLGMARRSVREVYPRILEFSELQEAIGRPVKHFSAGMRSRLGFSILASIESDIFIIDEALGAGDAAFQEKASVLRSSLRKPMRSS